MEVYTDFVLLSLLNHMILLCYRLSYSFIPIPVINPRTKAGANMYTTRNGFTDSFNLSRLFSEENASLSFSLDREHRSLDIDIVRGNMQLETNGRYYSLVSDQVRYI